MGPHLSTGVRVMADLTLLAMPRSRPLPPTARISTSSHTRPPLSADGISEYHQYRGASEHLTDSNQGYRAGRRGLRNAQDRAREHSSALRDEIKKTLEATQVCERLSLQGETRVFSFFLSFVCLLFFLVRFLVCCLFGVF